MNRTTLVFATTMTLLSSALAVDISNTNIVGAVGVPGGAAAAIGGNGPHTIDNSTLTGGASTAVTDSSEVKNKAYGGNGLTATLFVPTLTNREIIMNDSVISGGGGGNGTFSEDLTDDFSAYGGNGAAAASGHFYLENTVVTGGDGGALSAPGGAFVVNVDGGSGVSVNSGLVWIRSSYAYGGDGGTATTVGADSASSASGGIGVNLLTSTYNNSLVDSVAVGGDGGYFNNGALAAAADGGVGFYASTVSGSLVISNSTLTGGDGGTVVGSASSTASGGAGLELVSASSVQIVDAVISGGSAGSVNGATGTAGASLDLSDSAVSISGGQLIGDLLFGGTGTSMFSMQDTVFSDAVLISGGIVNVTNTSDEYFQDTTIADGTLNYSGQVFSLDGILELQAATASANFNDGLTVESGATLDLGLGTVTASDATVAGSVITEYDGEENGTIEVTGDLTVESGATWTIDAGDNEIALDTVFTLASADGVLSNEITKSAIKFAEGTTGEAGWLGGISALEIVEGVLLATYGGADIDVALGVDGDTSTAFGKAMADLAAMAPSGSDEYEAIKSLMSSAAEGGYVMTNGYVRTAEMANSLINLQSVFSDQVLSRSHSKLHYDQVGYPQASAPAGAAGWDSVRTFADRVEPRVSTDGLRSFSDQAEDRFGYDEIHNAVDGMVPTVYADGTGLPADWQFWGNGFGSSIEQDSVDGFAGYDATVAGAMVGIDKRINNMLVGIGGGYALTHLNGDAGNDGKANSANAVAYFATHGDKAFFDASVSYAFNSVETENDALEYAGDFDAHTLGLYVGGGYKMAVSKNILFVPEASLQNTLYARDAYTKTSSIAGLPDLNYDDYDQWSHQARLGATVSWLGKIDFSTWELAVQPEVRAYYMHEFNADMDGETYRMEGGTYDLSAALLAREEDLFKVGAGLRFNKWASDEIEVDLDVDGTIGDNYEALIVSGKIIRRF